MQCINCGSYECVSNKLDAAALTSAIRGAYPGISNLATVGVLTGLHFGNKLRKDWACTNCGHKF